MKLTINSTNIDWRPFLTNEEEEQEEATQEQYVAYYTNILNAAEAIEDLEKYFG